ncbi:MAG: aspartyl protease [Prevotella sp.]|nr:aspartyl protease [Prevotella sp.]
MRRMFVFLVWLLSISASAQTYRYSTSFVVSQRNFCDTIPIDVVDGHAVVTVTMGGERMRMMIDTGSAQGMVFQNRLPAYWKELGNIVSHDANNHTDTVKVVGLPPFELGGSTISGYVATVMPRARTTDKWDAIIGFDLFNKGLTAKIDTRRKVLILSDRKKLFDEEEGYEMKYKLKWFVPYVMVSPFIRHTDEVLFDTGATPLYEMNKQSFDTHAYKSKNVGSQVEDRTHGSAAIAGHSVEQDDEVVLLHLNRLECGGFEFRDVRALTTQGSSRIGAAVMDYAAVVINPFKKRLKLQPYSSGDSVHVGNKMFGTAFVPVNGRPTVGLIFATSDAYIQGLRQGDIIESIDGERMYTFRDFTRFPFVKGRKHKFVVVDSEGNRKELMVER